MRRAGIRFGPILLMLSLTVGCSGAGQTLFAPPAPQITAAASPPAGAPTPTADSGCASLTTVIPSQSGPCPSPSPTSCTPVMQTPPPAGSVSPPPAGVLPAHATGDHLGNLTIENIPTQYGSLIQSAVTTYDKRYCVNLTAAFIEAIIFQESRGDPNTQSQDGQDSEGLMQVSTGPGYDIADVLSPGGDQYSAATSIDTGVHLLAIMDGCGSALDPIVGTFYGAFPGACGDLLLLASKFQGGPQTRSINTYGNQIGIWMQSFQQGMQPTESNGASP